MSSSTSESTVESQLHNIMGTFSCFGGQATTFDSYINGMNNYCTQHGVNTLWTITTDHSYTTLKSEIDASRPGTIMYWGIPDYGYHYVTFVGYYHYYVSDQQYYIIHDGWGSSDVYRNWKSDADYFGDLVKTYYH